MSAYCDQKHTLKAPLNHKAADSPEALLKKCNSGYVCIKKERVSARFSIFANPVHITFQPQPRTGSHCTQLHPEGYLDFTLHLR